MKKPIIYRLFVITTILLSFLVSATNNASAQKDVTYTISGKIADSETGLPMQCSICLFTILPGTDVYNAIDKTIPKDDGTYSFTAQAGMKYKVVAYPWDNNYETVYYNQATNLGEATELELTRNFTDINFSMVKKPVYNNGLMGIVKNTKGESVSASVYARAVNDPNGTQYYAVPGNSDIGLFSISNLRPGNYILYAYPNMNNLYDGYYKENDVAVSDPTLATIIKVPETGILDTKFVITLADKDPSSIIFGLKGIIMSESGAPLSDVNISIIDQNGNQVISKSVMKTDASGYFYFEFSGYYTGKFILTAKKDGYSDATAGLYFDEKNPYQSITLIMQGPPLDNGIKGIVTNTDGEGVYAKISLLMVTSDGKIGYNQYGKTDGTSFDTPGEFKVTNIVPGKYIIAAYPADGNLDYGYYKANASAVKDPTDATIITVNEKGINNDNYVIILPKAEIKPNSYELYGYVIDDNNAPVSDVIITAFDAQGNEVTANQDNKTDKSGMFHIFFNTYGVYQVKATKEGYIDASGILTFDESMPIQKTMIQLTTKTIQNSGSGDSKIIAGVKNDDNSPGMYLYPNPAEDILYISSNSKIQYDNFKIFSSTGNLLLTQQSNSETTLNVSEFVAGAYIIRFFNADKLIDTRMFIKK